MNTPHAFPRLMHKTNTVASAFMRVARAPLNLALLLCATALLSTSCGSGSDAEASASTAAGGGPADGSQTSASPGASSDPVGNPGGTTPMGPTEPNATSGDPSAGGSIPPGPVSGGTASTPPAGMPTGAGGGASSGGADAIGPIAGAGGALGGSNSGGSAAEATGGTSTGGASSGGAAAGGSGTAGSDAIDPVSDEATIVPDPGWACGMAEGIPAPSEGELAFTITLEINAEYEVGTTPYGYRRLLDVTGGTITGDRLQGTVVTGGLEFELTLENGVMEYQGINVLETSAGRIFVRSCGVAADADSGARIIPDFEASTSGDNAFLNTGTWVATREVTGGTMKLDVYDVSGVTPGEPRVEIQKPVGVPEQPWECNTTTGSQGAEVLTENVSLGGSYSINNAKYGSRNIIPITGGTTTGRVTGAILDGGADYQLAGSLDAWYTLAPDNGEYILVRNCGGASGLIPWFEAAVDGEFDFLNTQAYLSSPPGVGAGGVSITFYERQ